MTTGEPARVISCYQEGDKLKGVKMKFKMDVKKNKGMLMEREDFPAEHTGVCIELQFKRCFLLHGRTKVLLNTSEEP